MLNEEKYTQHLDTTVEKIKKQKDGKLIISNQKTEWKADYVIFATQPFQALPIIKDIANKELVSELEKWDKMDCYVVLHSDFSNIQNMPWLHQTHRNRTTKNLYITNTIKPIMSDLNLEYVITFVYNKENYEDFIANNIDNSKIVKVYEPKLPIFTLENSVNRNDIWKEIDNKCTDIYWTQACKSGLQYHNNGILNAKRLIIELVKKINN